MADLHVQNITDADEQQEDEEDVRVFDEAILELDDVMPLDEALAEIDRHRNSL